VRGDQPSGKKLDSRQDNQQSRDDDDDDTRGEGVRRTWLAVSSSAMKMA
jgi:hypothetical protein